jgi:tRNA threonylcarbamoyladenosine biosynthesis protein TsaE
MNIRVNNEGELHQAASELLKFSEKEKVFLFEGDMGAGKTTLIKSIMLSPWHERNCKQPYLFNSE